MRSLLKECSLFQGCTAQELDKVAAACDTKAVAAGEVVLEAESPAEHLYVVSEGSVELRFTVTHYVASEEIPIDRMLRGDVLGWSAVVAPHTFTLSAVAVKDSQLLRISSSDIKRWCAEDDHFGHVLMRNLADIIGQRFNMVQRMLIDVIQDRLKKQEPGG
jgi:CRP-like cAMP-binding protein